MILTITPNPSLDRTYDIATLERGTVLRADTDRVDPGGKGVNLSRAIGAAGLDTTAVLPLGGPEGALLARLLERLGIDVAGVDIDGSTRVNVAVIEADATLTKINAAGPLLAPAEADALLARVREHAPGATWTACCGSLPRGLGPRWYAELVATAHAAGARIALDTSGPALPAALAQRPDVIKPNTEELAEAVGRPVTTIGEALSAADELRASGARAVLASLGADGQLLVEDGGRYWGHAPVAVVRSDVGAGDASLAGFLAAGGAGPDALAAAVAHGAAAVQLPGSSMPTPADLRPHEVTVTADPPTGRQLSSPAVPANGAAR
ncbi:1-phosphofructokinase [Streptomyces spiramenti]|uniref:1-phosphofructokinase n=1 Tax=Streptomyces spiramenti TaxID=2720606 RepID=A0ABX1ATR6_9ACTN|nr:1-phosphofructokinase [Streptomyces spiramenti]NJP69006.1 1-phosphofructokinase [Streptomyces spiramenti]